MDLYPAIDLRGGRCVRLVEGDFARETVYGDDPVAVAESFAAAGARWIHVVDLDAARTGRPVNRSTVAAIASAVAPAGVAVQAGGGVRSIEAAAALVDAGVARVVIGTAAVEDPSLVAGVAARWPGRVAVGLDHRGGEVRLRGWTEGGGRTVGELVPAAVESGAAAVIVTDISRDGRLVGPDVAGLAELAGATGAPVIASGGVGSMDDIRALAAVPGLIGVIAGKAIYEGRIDVAEAVGLLT
jgi:phosphoribosylformimino-5-aminoimidazole carboxamide ribotide isomerase